jgi:hypothetical protein
VLVYLAVVCGYPDDPRSDELRGRAGARLEGDFEATAGRVVTRLTGERLVIQDDNSRDSMPDIRTRLHGQVEGAC